MSCSIETSEAEARPFTPVAASPALPGNPVADARFCIAHPDILHTPQQMRDIIAGLLRKIDNREACTTPNCKCGAEGCGKA